MDVLWENLNRGFTGIAYYTEEGSGKRIEASGAGKSERSIKEVAERAVASGNLNKEEREAAERLVKEGIDEECYQQVRKASFGANLRGLNSFENIAVSLTEGYFNGYDPFRFPQVFDEITKEDIQAFLRENITEERCVLSEIVPR